MSKNLFLILITALLSCAIDPVRAADTALADIASTTYFPVLPFEAAPDTEPQLVPVASNHPIEGDHAGLTNAIIAVHDFTRDAQNTMSTLAGLAGTNNGNTIIIAPQFLLDFDIARFGARLPDNGRMFARWPLDGWENGGDSIAKPPAKPVSAFTALDLMLLYLSDKKSFPDLQQITIAGHGAGGDFVQRYAASSRALDVMAPGSPPVRFLVTNASSYLYLTGLRPHGKGFTTPNATNCRGLNAYPYGLDRLNDYMRRVGASAMKMSFPSRNITYLIGEKAANSDPLPDNSCAAMLQGPDRTLRASYYRNYLNQAFGEELATHQKFYTILKAAYNPSAMFGSPCGMAVLFGDGICESAPIGNVKTFR